MLVLMLFYADVSSSTSRLNASVFTNMTLKLEEVKKSLDIHIHTQVLVTYLK